MTNVRAKTFCELQCLSRAALLRIVAREPEFEVVLHWVAHQRVIETQSFAKNYLMRKKMFRNAARRASAANPEALAALMIGEDGAQNSAPARSSKLNFLDSQAEQDNRTSVYTRRMSWAIQRPEMPVAKPPAADASPKPSFKSAAPRRAAPHRRGDGRSGRRARAAALAAATTARAVPMAAMWRTAAVTLALLGGMCRRAGRTARAPESAAKESRRMTIWMRAPTARRARTGRSFVRRFASRTTASAIRRRHQLARAAARTPARAALRPAGRE